jgi:uncharacterized protein (TIGR03032 family)
MKVETSSADADANQQVLSEPASQLLRPDQLSITRGFANWLLTNNVSLAFTSYQSGRVYLVGVDQHARVAVLEIITGRAMGLWADDQRLIVATQNQIWEYENILMPGQVMDGKDRHYIARHATTTGNLDVHDVAVDGEGRIVFVNTLFSCLATLSPRHSFRPVWRPPFISRLAAEDRCHLNGLAMRDGAAAFVTATSRSDAVNGWRARRAEGGCLIDVASSEIVTQKLSMPHSPRFHDGKLWLLDSGSGYLGTVDLSSGAFEPAVFCPGFLRGLAFTRHFALVGLSLPRDGSFSGLALDEEMKKRDTDPWCGVQIIDLRTGDIVEWFRFTTGITEMYDVAVLPGVRNPGATAPSSNELSTLISIDHG